MKKIWIFLSSLTASLFLPLAARAHEVYVLTPEQIAAAKTAPSFSLLQVAVNDLGNVVFWGIVGVLLVAAVFWFSTLSSVERRLDPFFTKARPYGPFIARLTIGISFLASAYYQATYGPELPLSAFGAWAGWLTILLIAIGIFTIIGLYTRVAATIGLLIYAVAVWHHGWYMLTYVNYLGEIIVLLILGSHDLGIDHYLLRRKKKSETPEALSSFMQTVHKIKNYLAPRSFAILRVLFGTALIYASFYAKVLYNNLALLTVEQYHLDKLLGFEPHFLVLGAALVELLIGLFFVLGIELRFTSLFFLFWLILSLIFFGEVVWPHLILIGIPIAYLFYGYDDYSVEGWLFRKKKYTPVL